MHLLRGVAFFTRGPLNCFPYQTPKSGVIRDSLRHAAALTDVGSTNCGKTCPRLFLIPGPQAPYRIPHSPLRMTWDRPLRQHRVSFAESRSMPGTSAPGSRLASGSCSATSKESKSDSNRGVN